ncbi:putative yippee-like protein [Colletotrichum karsti]|uniref:Yippee-like protein n=1 Tax=Colletotrichum karsti TaxID=1095194 RepID=A0A9P6I4K5_9PEZI|nr:putative yippee-like protein [Colletotrichum karsti]KAF9875662.1 putative yippee-like protein [Colletotrichum karsti]
MSSRLLYPITIFLAELIPLTLVQAEGLADVIRDLISNDITNSSLDCGPHPPRRRAYPRPRRGRLPTMGLAYNTYLNSSKVYGCKTCKAHLSNHEDIISRVRSSPLLNLGRDRKQTNRTEKDDADVVENMLTAASLSSAQNFRGQHGKAYLFNSVVNIETGEPSERNMTTGRHIVRDITCKQCKETVGWKYDKAYEATEKYKEGKFILEAELLCNVT